MPHLAYTMINDKHYDNQDNDTKHNYNCINDNPHEYIHDNDIQDN
jgi:hypothetical protein